MPWRPLIVLLTAGTLLTACAGFVPDRSEGVSGSLVDFLYPDGQRPPEPHAGSVQLRVPVTVGLAFVPANDRRTCCGRGIAPSAALQAELLERTRRSFDSRDYIREIQIIPEPYLRTGKGFTTLEQLSRLYGFDVIALVSHDQVALQGERKSSLLYWTLAGAYVIKGNRHDVHTFVDTAVIDVTSRRLLFRAPGIDVRAANTTLVESRQNQQALLEAGLRNAMDGMIANLDAELSSFRERIRTDDSVTVTRRDGRTTGAGPATLSMLILLLAGAAGRRRLRRPTNR